MYTIGEILSGNSGKVEKKSQRGFNLMSKTGKEVKRTSAEDLAKEAKVATENKKAREESLVSAYEDKKLKSKGLIKEAKRLAEKRK